MFEGTNPLWSSLNKVEGKIRQAIWSNEFTMEEVHNSKLHNVLLLMCFVREILSFLVYLHMYRVFR